LQYDQNMKIQLLLRVLLIVSMLFSCKQEWNEIAISSPDSKLQLIFDLNNGKPTYKLNLNGKPIVLESQMGFRLQGRPALDSNFILLDRKVRSINESWEQIWGEEKIIYNNYNEVILYLKESTGSERSLNITFRLYNSGLGFRYEFPEQENLNEFQISEELTNFTLANEADVWWIPAYQPERYEYLYKKSKLSEVDTAHTPLTVETKDGLFLSFHEAALYDFPSYTLYASDTNILALDLVPWSNRIKAYVKTPFVTPWRTIQVAEEPQDLITNYLILNLNDTCRIADTSWIEPTKYVGIWWEMHIDKYTWASGKKHGATTERTKQYIDFAAKYGFGGVLIEGWNIGWDGDWIKNGELFSFTEPYPDFDIEYLAKYAKEKGISLIGHHETSGQIDNYEKQMEEAYKMYENLGIRYLKTGYVGAGYPGGRLFNGEWHHGQYAVRHFQRSVELAARHHIMLNIHESVKDCGLRRTWPNLMSREGARGMEYNAWSPDGGNPPDYIPTLVFTRLLAGPMDYTPGIFDLEIPTKPGNRVNTTLAKQLAYYVIIYSPLQMAADLPENYEGNPAFQFIRDVPCDWEKTVALNGKIGNYVTIARKDRNSDNWYLGSITDEEARNLKLRADFLEARTKYLMNAYADGEDADWISNPLSLKITQDTIERADTIYLKLAPGGGTAIQFVPIPKK